MRVLGHNRLATVAGNTTALTFWASASALGLTALIKTSEIAFMALKIAGAAYLCWLGVQTFLRSRRADAAAAAEPVAQRSSLFSACRAGLLTNLTNPKAAVPGTAMGFAGVPRAHERAELIAYLNSLSDNPAPLPKAAMAPSPN